MGSWKKDLAPECSFYRRVSTHFQTASLRIDFARCGISVTGQRGDAGMFANQLLFIFYKSERFIMNAVTKQKKSKKPVKKMPAK
jgi:hypothetical protein